jgi:L-amino acid N-acyltransferase YncA
MLAAGATPAGPHVPFGSGLCGRVCAVDWPAVAAVYAEGIATGNATFETEVPAWEQWDAVHLPDHRLVAEIDGRVVGWTAVSPVSSRCI